MNNNPKVIDCFGDICPVPIIKIEQELKIMKPGESFILVTDHSCTIEAIREKYRTRKVDIRIEEVMNGVWEVYIAKR